MKDDSLFTVLSSIIYFVCLFLVFTVILIKTEKIPIIKGLSKNYNKYKLILFLS